MPPLVLASVCLPILPLLLLLQLAMGWRWWQRSCCSSIPTALLVMRVVPGPGHDDAQEKSNAEQQRMRRGLTPEARGTTLQRNPSSAQAAPAMHLKGLDRLCTPKLRPCDREAPDLALLSRSYN